MTPLLNGEGRRTRRVRGERFAALLFITVAAACGRTDPFRSAPAPAQQQPTFDAGEPPDAGPPDAGQPVISDGGLCPQSADAGFLTGATPLGPISYGYLWIGTEAPTTHSCPHLTVHASPYPPGSTNVPLLSIDFGASRPIPPLPFDVEGFGTFQSGGATVTFGATAHVTRADGLTIGHQEPNDQWVTTLTFEARDAGFDLTGTVDTLECPGSTWECL